MTQGRSDDGPNFEGHDERDCGEHRTVGAHRAWCFDCSEWCYPGADGACKGCERPQLLARAVAAEDELAAAQAKIAAMQSDETVERVAQAVYELNRDPEYSGEEWDWPNIDRSYDYDDDGEPSPEWLRDRFRADVRFVLAAASGVTPDKPTICEHSGMTVQRCKDIGLCDCFDQPNGDKR